MSGPSNETENEKRLERIALALERIALALDTARINTKALEKLASCVEDRFIDDKPRLRIRD